MKNKYIRFILLVLSVVMVLAVASCESETSGNLDKPNNELSKESEPILADLNSDGTDDKIFIIYDNEEKTSATIKVISGKDDTELMTDTLKLNEGKIGAYYLQVGKQNYPDRLVFWNYNYLDGGQLAFTYSVFSYGPDGKAVYGDRGNKTFDIGPGAQIASNNIPFGVMIEGINENIRPTDIEYNAYLLIINQGESISVSTKDNMLAPSALTFTLENFVK